MKNIFSRWFNGGESETAVASSRSAVQAPPLVFRPNMTFPIVDWEAMDVHAPTTEDSILLDEFWSVTARAWLEAMQVHLGNHFTVRESERFLLLSALD